MFAICLTATVVRIVKHVMYKICTEGRGFRFYFKADRARDLKRKCCWHKKNATRVSFTALLEVGNTRLVSYSRLVSC